MIKYSHFTPNVLQPEPEVAIWTCLIYFPVASLWRNPASAFDLSFAILAKDQNVVANDHMMTKWGIWRLMEIFGRKRKVFGSQLGMIRKIPGKTWTNTKNSRTRSLDPKTAFFPTGSTQYSEFSGLKPERSRTELPEAVRAHTCPPPTDSCGTEPHMPSFIDCGDFPSIDKFSCRPHGETASVELIFLSPAAGGFTHVNSFFSIAKWRAEDPQSSSVPPAGESIPFYFANLANFRH
jgi:hypothetical protein